MMDRGPFRSEEIELQVPQLFFGGDDPASFASGPADLFIAWASRYRNTQYLGKDVVADLIALSIDCFNTQTENRTEVCNHAGGNDIDFISFFEKYLTLDRILLECIIAATAMNLATAG
ncbi:MAG: hypothetical protein KatS3mg109_0440 [Pirellulaceae bacterium]|nr:MAG: hypothetical protein KatS3mg109_0440 [Pirellulaceae bacterium]